MPVCLTVSDIASSGCPWFLPLFGSGAVIRIDALGRMELRPVFLPSSEKLGLQYFSLQLLPSPWPPSLSFCALGGLFSHRLLAMAGNRGPSSLFLPPTLPRYILPFISCKVIPLRIYTQYTSSSYQHVRSVSNL